MSRNALQTRVGEKQGAGFCLEESGLIPAKVARPRCRQLSAVGAAPRWGPGYRNPTSVTTARGLTVGEGKRTGGPSLDIAKGHSSSKEHPPGSRGPPTDARNIKCRTLLLRHSQVLHPLMGLTKPDRPSPPHVSGSHLRGRLKARAHEPPQPTETWTQPSLWV